MTHRVLDSRIIMARRRNTRVVIIITRKKVTSRPRAMTVITSTTRNTVTKAVTLPATNGRNQTIVNETNFSFVLSCCLVFLYKCQSLFISLGISWNVCYAIRNSARLSSKNNDDNDNFNADNFVTGDEMINETLSSQVFRCK